VNRRAENGRKVKTFSLSAGRTFTPMQYIGHGTFSIAFPMLLHLLKPCLRRPSQGKGKSADGDQQIISLKASGGNPLMATRSTPSAQQSAPNYLVPFIIVTALFGIFGFLTSLNNQLVNKLKEIFNLPHGPAMLATAAWFFAYLVFSVPSGKLIEKVGYKNTMVISLFIMVVGALLFVPAAHLVSFNLTLFAIFVLASGVCALQTSANPYVSILGPEHSAAARLNLAQAFNSGASALAPWVAATFILADTSKAPSAASEAHMLQGPYVLIAAALLVLGFVVMFLHLPAIAAPPHADGAASHGRGIWTYRHTVLGMVGIFFYVGIEIALASIGIQYFRAQGISSLQAAGILVLLYYISIMIGRFVGSFLMKWIPSQKMLVVLGLFGVALLLVSMFAEGPVAIWSLVLCGLANSVMYPTIFALGIAELGPMTSEGSGVITIGNVGGAVIPFLFGWLADAIGEHYAAAHNLPYLAGGIADKIGIQYAFIIPIVGYLFVTYYGFSGYKPRRAVKA
jgi:FHS family L-fucose permease-like MFS transporter